jgi:hypothetical protein
MEAIKELHGVKKRLHELALGFPPESSVAQALHAEVLQLARLMVPAAITMEALNPVFDLEGGNSGYLKVADLTYNAFMIGRNMENRETGGRCDWFNDTWPLMKAGVERIQKECVERLAYVARTYPRKAS